MKQAPPIGEERREVGKELFVDAFARVETEDRRPEAGNSRPRFREVSKRGELNMPGNRSSSEDRAVYRR